MNKKSSAGTGTYSIIFGVAFVWFTTHFGGGFASGAQIYSYYVRFGIWCLIIGIFIFIVAIFGTDLVRRVASVLSICIIAGLLIVYIPNIIHGWSAIRATAQQMTTSTQPFGKALYSAFLYGTFQLANIAVFVQHAKVFKKPGDAVKSMGLGFIINALMMTMVCLGIMTVSTSPDMAGTSVPTLLMVQNGIGKGFMTPLISILIILGAVSTAVNMVAAMVKRVSDGLKKRILSGKNDVSAGTPKAETPDINTRKRISSREIIIALICCLIDFGIAQFGLLTLIQKAYSFLAYLAIPVILVPYIIHMIVTRMDSK